MDKYTGTYYCRWCEKRGLTRGIIWQHGQWIHVDTQNPACDEEWVATPNAVVDRAPLSSDDDIHSCSEHPDTMLVYERGGTDMPTIHGRWYCPKCQILLNEALDAQEKK